jgi:(p)ppGpp synthase/HD superfamily hydrolase
MKRDNWITSFKENNIKTNIFELTKNIEDNNMKLGQYLNDLSNVGELDYKELKISETKVKQLIKNHLFATKYNLTKDIGFSKLTLLTKVKEIERIEEIIEFSYSSTLQELKNFIYNHSVQNFVSKNILLDDEDQINFEISKKICEKISGSTLNSSQIFKFILMDFINTNIETLEPKELEELQNL